MEDNSIMREATWFHQHRAPSVFKQLDQLLRDCCRQLYVSNKVDALATLFPRSANQQTIPSSPPSPLPHALLPPPHQAVVEMALLPRSGQDNLNATVTLQGENILHTEVSLKYAKTAAGFYRATAQPEVQWKLQQIQDAANHCVKALQTLNKGAIKYTEAVRRQAPTHLLQDLLLSVLLSVKEDLRSARTSLTLPKRKTLVELCQFQPLKSFNPPLPHDILLSYYVASAKLVCAAYQVVSKVNGVQTVTIYQAECHLPRLSDALHLLGSAFALANDITSNCAMLKSMARGGSEQ